MIQYVLWLAVGVLLGWLYVLSQKKTADYLDINGSVVIVFWCMSGMLLRVALFTAAFLIALQSGLVSALIMTAGFIAAKWQSLIYFVRNG